MTTKRGWCVALVIFALLLAACSGDDSTEQTAAVAPAQDEVAESTDSARSVGDASNEPEIQRADPAIEAATAPDDNEAGESAAEPVVEEVVESTDSTNAAETTTTEAPENDAPTAARGQSIAVPDIGTSAWAIVVAGSTDPFDPLLEETEQQVINAGYASGITNCDVGAAVAIGMQASGSFTVAAYAADEANARLIAGELDAIGLSGEVVEIVVDCG